METPIKTEYENSEIYVGDQNEVLSPYQVTRMKTLDFFITRKIEKKIDNGSSPRAPTIRAAKSGRMDPTYCNLQYIGMMNTLVPGPLGLRRGVSLALRLTSLATHVIESEDRYSQVGFVKKKQSVLVKFSVEDFGVLWPQGKPIPRAKLNGLRPMFGLIPEDGYDFYKNFKGNSNINENIDEYRPTLDFDMEEDE